MKTLIAYAVYRLWVLRIRIYDLEGVEPALLPFALAQRGAGPWPRPARPWRRKRHV